MTRKKNLWIQKKWTSESTPIEENKIQQPDAGQLSTMDHADNTPAESQEPEGDVEPDVRWSTRTNEGVPHHLGLSYLTKTEAIFMAPLI